ncbi:MAG: ArsA-related P-loop ATPase, partial [Myxococcota bacterium]|nr:ArsA-related P-loop ATPase [Myxococcota bacterium]
MKAQVILCCGSGGVGKTTISAALGLKWAMEGAKVAVITIDPARRLADSLGLDTLDHEPRPVDLPGPRTTDGHLDALVIDMRATFDDMVTRMAPSSEAVERILGNRYYQFTSTRLAGVHEYMALELLLRLWTRQGDEAYDVIVLDTPPTRHALDFLEAPRKLLSLMDDGVLKWLMLPSERGGWRALELGSEAVTRVLRKLAGRGTIGEIAEFFESFRGTWDRLRDRSNEAMELLNDPMTQALLITTPAPRAREEALFFLNLLEERGLRFSGFIVNRAVLPAAEGFDPDEIPERDGAVRSTLVEAVRLHRDNANAHRKAISALREQAPEGTVTWCVPQQQHELHHVEGLLSLLEHLPDCPDQPAT